VPPLKAAAPTQSEPPFAFTQLVVLTAFLILTVVAAIRFRPEASRLRVAQPLPGEPAGA
jgi:hypothetical protein